MMKDGNFQAKDTGRDACATNINIHTNNINAHTNPGGTGFQPVKNFRIYRRNLPHWEQPGAVYFITFRTTQSFILPEEARDIVAETVKFHAGKKYDLYAFVIMPDHVHLIILPLEKSKATFYSLSEIMHSIKSYSANQINRKLDRIGSVLWLDENFDRIIRDEDELLEKMNYILNNPMKRNLVEDPTEYRWLYLKGWLG